MLSLKSYLSGQHNLNIGTHIWCDSLFIQIEYICIYDDVVQNCLCLASLAVLVSHFCTKFGINQS